METIELERHRLYVRRVAARLLDDSGLAEDVVQETCLAALLRPPRRGIGRAWLVQVARNFALQANRGDRSRRRREESVARAEAQPTREDCPSGFPRAAALLREARRLPDPLRDPLLLRYGAGLPPREIARRLGLPVETVRTRVKRGVASLRERARRQIRREAHVPGIRR